MLGNEVGSLSGSALGGIDFLAALAAQDADKTPYGVSLRIFLGGASASGAGYGGGSPDTIVALRRIVKRWRPMETLTLPRSTGVTCGGVSGLRGW